MIVAPIALTCIGGFVIFTRSNTGDALPRAGRHSVGARMKLNKLVTFNIVTVGLLLGATALSAQSRAGSQPAEFPPSSFTGKQYVDSTGCVFIRAGIDGNVSWVPRVSRSRGGVCGFKPTFAGAVTPAAPAPVQTAAVEQITLDAPVAPAPAPAAVPAPRPAPERVVRAPAPQPQPQVVRQVAQQRPAPVATPQPTPARVVRSAPDNQACPGASPISGQYLQRGKLPVRCGPQAAPIVGARISTAPAPRAQAPQQRQVAVAAPTGPISVSQDRRIVPRHVAVNRVNTTNVQVPEGFTTVWQDGRLNPKRAEQSLAGHRAMNLIWTSTVPRRLINQADGRDVTASVPLVFPFVDFEAQQRELGQVTIVRRDGQTLKRIVRNVRGIVQPEPGQARVATVQRQPVLSSRSAPKAAPKATQQQQRRAQPKGEVAGRGFVQVGTFSDAAAAQRQARQVRSMGLPVRVGRFTNNGQTTRMVIAGPFGGQGDVNRAISRLRGAGMSAKAR